MGSTLRTRLERAEKALGGRDDRPLFWIVVGDEPDDEEKARLVAEARRKGQQIVVWE